MTDYEIEVYDREAAPGAAEGRIEKAFKELERVRRAGRRQFAGAEEIFTASNGVRLTLRKKS